LGPEGRDEFKKSTVRKQIKRKMQADNNNKITTIMFCTAGRCFKPKARDELKKHQLLERK
jgi:adenylate kinase